MSQLFAGLPFGPSLYFLFLIGLLCTGAVLCIQRDLRRAGLPILTLAVFLTIYELEAEDVEMKPVVERAEVVGVWRDWSDSIKLKADGKYVLKWESKKYEGTWENDDFRLLLSPARRDVGFYPRLVRNGSELRLVTNYRGIDLWNGDLGFSKR